METIELEREIMTEDKPLPEILTDSNMFGEKKALSKLDTSNYGDFSIIILLAKNPAFKNNLKPFDIDIYGKKMFEWVMLACDGYPVKTTACSPEANVVNLVKPLLSETKFTAVFYSDTPLLQKSTIEEIFMFARSRDINVLKLTRGYIFNTQYLKTLEEISVVQTEYFEEEDFLTCYNYKQLSIISDMIKTRILNFHMENGVEIKDINSTYIDCDVIIEPGTIIFPNNTIRGISYIGKNCLIENGNIIENSIISEFCKLSASIIKESRISENSSIGPFEFVDKQSL